MQANMQVQSGAAAGAGAGAEADTAAGTIARTAARRTNPRTNPRSNIGAYITLTKPRIVLLLLVTTLPAMFLAHGGVPAASLMLATVIGGALAAMGANAANMVLDRDIDSIMERTRGRPLPAGELSVGRAVAWAVVLELAALAVFVVWVNWLSAALSLGAAVFYVAVYTWWLKRRSPSNIVIGGAAGSVPPLVGWAAVTGGLDWPPVLLFALIFFWTPPHFWALAVRYREDYGAAGVPMLPVVAELRTVADRMLAYTVVVVALSLGFVPVAGMGAIYAAAAGLLGAGFLGYALLVRARLTEQNAMKLFFYSMWYVLGIFAAITADVLIIT